MAPDRPVTIVTAPMDAAIANLGGRRGAAEGPDAVLAELRARGGLDHVRVVAAPVTNEPADLEADLEALRATVAEACAGGGPVLVLGGDHGTTYASARGAAVGGVLGVLVYVDVHWDLRPYEPHTSGSSFRRLIEEGVVDPHRVHALGIARPTDPERLARSRFDELAAYAASSGMHGVGLDEVKRAGVATIVADRLADAPDPRYLSLDLDVLDERDAPGVSAPGPGRLRTRQLVAAARRCAPLARVVDIVETSPPLDPSGRTVGAAADVAEAVLGAWRGG